ADSDNNNRLTGAEIRAASESLMLFAEMGAQTTLDAAAISKIKERAKNEGDKIAADLMARYDANKSGDLDYNEIVENFTPPALPVIREMAEKAGSLLPALRVAATALPRDTQEAASDKSEPAPASKTINKRKDY
ncbi:MAG: hypothetical protein Q8K65_12200, partial [Alphaproteobacteria bacterium]|nr:hypothetical protein [Alphaproteobacteria bacterium]